MLGNVWIYELLKQLDICVFVDTITWLFRNIDTNSSYETQEWIERIIILGLSKKPKAVSIKIGGYID